MDKPVSEVSHPEFAGHIGIARCDITPPVGIYARMWGSAPHDVAEGVHRPLTATVLTLRSPDEHSRPLVLAALDLGWWRSSEDEEYLRLPIISELSLNESQLMIHLTHTHSGPSTSLHAADKLGGDKIEPYLRSVQRAVIDAYHEARSNERKATLTWNVGRCNLACHRDQHHPSRNEVVVGYDPTKSADDTVVVGRVADVTGKIVATIVNYACHPTSLGWANRLISPDYVGAMRDVVEQATDDAPCLFLNGAAGELAPRRQYTGRCEVADQNGRQLGYAALATLSDMLPQQTTMRFERVEESTTKLGYWSTVAHDSDTTLRSQQLRVELPLRQVIRPEQFVESNGHNDRAVAERIERTLQLWNGMKDAKSAPFPIWLWRVGSAVLVGTPAEMHSPFQIELRRQFAEYAVVVLNIVNGTFGYLPPVGDYALDTYQCRTSLFDRGAHETVVDACVNAIKQLAASKLVTNSVVQPHFSSRRTAWSGKAERR